MGITSKQRDDLRNAAIKMAQARTNAALVSTGVNLDDYCKEFSLFNDLVDGLVETPFEQAVALSGCLSATQAEQVASVAAHVINDAGWAVNGPMPMPPLTPTEPKKHHLNVLGDEIHRDNVKTGWWDALDPWVDPLMSSMPGHYAKAERLALMHKEISGALDAIRTDEMDKHLPTLPREAVELADALIRILDYCAAYKIDIGQAVDRKRHFNRHRSDHKIDVRKKPDGKKF